MFAAVLCDQRPDVLRQIVGATDEIDLLCQMRHKYY